MGGSRASPRGVRLRRRRRPVGRRWRRRRAGAAGPAGPEPSALVGQARQGVVGAAGQASAERLGAAAGAEDLKAHLALARPATGRPSRAGGERPRPWPRNRPGAGRPVPPGRGAPLRRPAPRRQGRDRGAARPRGSARGAATCLGLEIVAGARAARAAHGRPDDEAEVGEIEVAQIGPERTAQDPPPCGIDGQQRGAEGLWALGVGGRHRRPARSRRTRRAMASATPSSSLQARARPRASSAAARRAWAEMPAKRAASREKL